MNMKKILTTLVAVLLAAFILSSASAEQSAEIDLAAVFDLHKGEVPDLPDSYTEGGSPVKLQTVVDGLVYPVEITFPGDASGRMFILQQPGQVLIFDGTEVLGTPFLDLSSSVSCCGERGLLSLAFHPDYETNGYFFVYYTYDTGTPSMPESRLARYSVSVDPNLADPSSEQILYSLNQPYINHNGGQLRFGPDGYLYLSLGDGGSSGDPDDRAQDLSSPFGTILRLDIDSGFPYVIPPDNPFLEDPDDPETLAEIWAYGLRNPWRFSFDSMTGDMLIGDVGQAVWEEINWIPAGPTGGENFGWRCYEGDDPYNLDGCGEIGAYEFPLFQYAHTLGCAVTGGYVYRGTQISALEGKYLYADYCSGRIWVGTRGLGDTWTSELLMDTPYEVTSFGQDTAGELYLTHYNLSNGKILKIVNNPPAADFDGDGDTDISVFRPSNGNWYVKGMSPVSWALAGDLPKPGDYDGDGTTDIAVYRPSNGNWYVKGQGMTSWGFPGDIPLQADYDGDGIDEIAVLRPSNGKWYIQGMGNTFWYYTGDIPVPCDYDGDGAVNIAVLRPSNHKWYIKGIGSFSWHLSGDIPVPADYDGNGTCDIAVYRPSNGNWYVKGLGMTPWGIADDIPVPGDYNADGAAEIAVLRPSTGRWYIQGMGNFSWYYTGDYPLPVRDSNADGDVYE